MQKKNKHMVCFVDADDGTAIQGAIEISIFKNQESPLFQQTDDQGCFSFEESEQPVRFVVDASYYKNDTIVRVFDKNQKKEIIKLHKDDFALMIHLVSTNNLKDWKKRRKQLDQMIDQDAVIFQVNKNHLGLEMYNKTEFINKLTMPINSLKNIKIVDTKYRKGKIFEMRFIQE